MTELSCPGGSVAVFDPTLTDYDFGPTHPMAPVRVDLTMLLTEELGVTGAGGLGLTFFRQMAMYNYGGVTTVILAILCLIILGEVVSTYARKAVI